MRKLLLVCFFVLGISALSHAQGGRRTPAEQLDQLKEQVSGITDDQAAKIKLIYETQGKKVDSLRTANGDGDFRALLPKIVPILNASNVKIKALLTAAQAPVFQKIVDERAAALKARMEGN